MTDSDVEDTRTLLATARCDSCGVVAELRAAAADAVEELIARFRKAFIACPKCESDLEIVREVGRSV